MLDYTIFYKRSWDPDKWPSVEKWDVLLSTFNNSDRVSDVFNRANATEKHWLACPEFSYRDEELPTSGRCFRMTSDFEADVIAQYFSESGIDPTSSRLCVDITGFVRPHLLFLLKYLQQRGVKHFDALYSEPMHYVKDERTEFSDGVVTEIRQVAGFEGTHSLDMSGDVLIIGAGYDDKLIAHIAEHKDNARKVRMFGLPSLRADMYQQNILRSELAAEQVGGGAADGEIYFAPANDPFVTAAALKAIVEKLRNQKKLSNLYLSPLATKVQTLGFGLYYLYECVGQSVSIVFPFCRTYERRTSDKISRVWKYEIELP